MEGAHGYTNDNRPFEDIDTASLWSLIGQDSGWDLAYIVCSFISSVVLCLAICCSSPTA